MPSSFKTWLSQKLLGEGPSPPTYQAQPRAAAEPFHAVSITPGLECCEAAKQLGKMRFLSGKAPRLPLPDCEAAECTCRYSHFSDRRSGVDRRSGYDWDQQRRLSGSNRRRSHGRRSTDPVG
jgi:hypothetical protein